MEQAAAHTLRNIGGLQHLSDTPEPAYLSNIQSQSQDFGLQPSALKELAGSSTPEFTPSMSQKAFLPGKENKILDEQLNIKTARHEDDSAQPLENGDKDSEEMPQNDLEQAPNLKEKKTKVPWR